MAAEEFLQSLPAPQDAVDAALDALARAVRSADTKGQLTAATGIRCPKCGQVWGNSAAQLCQQHVGFHFLSCASAAAIHLGQGKMLASWWAVQLALSI